MTTMVAAGVLGYSRLLGKDGASMLSGLKVHREELNKPKATQYHGRAVKLE